MTTTPTPAHVHRLLRGEVDAVVAALLTDFGQRSRSDAPLVNMFLLDALDRGEQDRFVVSAEAEGPRALLYTSPSGTLVPAGLAEAGPSLVEAAERTGWRVLVGDWAVSETLLDAYPRKLFRRRPTARQQRLMVTRTPANLPAPAGFRRARHSDVGVLTEMACRLHVEDLMGPPIAKTGRGGVRSRMADSVRRGLTYVVERGGRVVAKVDVSLYSRRRGAQLAGVYVDAEHRGQGIASTAVAAICDELLADGVPGVSLHVRADNATAIAAYRRAGMDDLGPWLLALR